MTQPVARGVPNRPVRFALTLGILAVMAVAAPASAGRPTVDRTINNHFHVERYFADGPCGPGVTEISDGNEHLVVVDDGSRLTVTYGETFWITAIPDDPSSPTTIRQGTDALKFVVQRDGDVLFHESFHDFGYAPWNPDAQIRFVTTFTTLKGEVHVDHFFINDSPPPGC